MAHPRNLLQDHGLAASKRRGQNFLTQAATAQAIAHSAEIGPQETVLEIGSGLGALTLALSTLARRVIAVEVDRGVHQALQGILAEQGADNVELLHADALALDWAELAANAGAPLVVVGNLPYNISSPLIFKLLEAEGAWRRASFMLQKEVVLRLAAKPGGKDYGRLTVLVQNRCQVTAGHKLAPDQFFPRPKVSSQVVHLIPRDQPLAPVGDPERAAWFSRVVKAAFGQRRKTLANALAGGLGLARTEVEAALTAVDLDPRLRAERLTIEQFGQAAGALAPFAPQTGQE